MSELKTYKMVDEKYCSDCVCVIPSEVYLKSEADKYIKELKEQNHELCQALHSMYSEEEMNYQKYKRCLAMAKLCRMHDEFTQLESERLGLPQRTLFLEYRRKAMWWNKWRKRWLELAEKFKEAK